MAEIKIKLDDKPHLSALLQSDRESARTIMGTFINLMEVAASNNWHKLPQAIHTSLSFSDIVGGVLDAVMTTEKIDPSAYATLESDLHPLALISDKRKNIITDEPEVYDWKSHFALDSDNVSRETLEHIIRKVLYLVRWFDIDTVSKSLITSQFPVVDEKDIMKLPFQPALMYQVKELGELHVGKFLHEVGAFNCGTIKDENWCPACKVGYLQYPEHVDNIAVCPRCNAGFTIEETIS